MKKADLVAKTMFMEKMGHMLDVGIPLYRTLKTLRAEIDSPLAKAAMDNMLKGIELQDEKFNAREWLQESLQGYCIFIHRLQRHPTGCQG